MEDNTQEPGLLSPPEMEPISRPASTSSQHSGPQSLAQQDTESHGVLDAPPSPAALQAPVLQSPPQASSASPVLTQEQAESLQQPLEQQPPAQMLQQPIAQMLPQQLPAHSLPQQMPQQMTGGLMALQATSQPGAHANMANSSQSSSAVLAPPAYAKTSPASTAGPGGNLPTCQNCATSTTPLWRRDEMGSVLCNACGLFLKLHGRPRPISLKTDVIKSRNRVKTMRPDLAKKKQQQQQQHQAQQNLPPGTDPNDMTGANMAAALGGRRPSKTNGHLDDTQSPISRTGTPNMYNNAHGLQMYPGMDDAQFQAQGLGFGVGATADGRVPSPMNGGHPSTQEALLAENASLKTRVSELEVIQELYRGRLEQLETEEAQTQQNKSELHSQLEAAQQTESQLRIDLEESHRRENMLKRRLDELELELKQTKESVEAQDSERHAKKPRLEQATTEEALEALKAESAPTPPSAA